MLCDDDDDEMQSFTILKHKNQENEKENVPPPAVGLLPRSRRVLSVPSDKGPSLRQLNSKSQELQLPLLRQNGDDRDESAADEEEEEEEKEIFLH